MACIRGPLVWPLGPANAVAMADGVLEPGLPAPRAPREGDPPPVDGVLVPAFADWHFHWVQTGIAGVGSRPLLAWLRETAWPAEARFADRGYCAEEAPAAVAALRRAGTLAGAAYGSPHPESAAAFLRAAPSGFACGPAIMTAGNPDFLRRPAWEALDELESLADAFDDRAIVAPRFALSCDRDTLRALGDLARSRGLMVQTHLAETVLECDTVRQRFPDAPDYTSIYEEARLVGPRSLLGHVIHVSDDELRRLAAAGAVVVHCPTSNCALGSGRMPLERMREAGIAWVLGSDVGAGPSLDLLDAVGAALSVHTGHADLSAVEAFHRAAIGRGALFDGATEQRLERLGARPGVLIVTALDGVSPEDGAEAWLTAWVARWRESGRSGIRRTLTWDEVAHVR